MRVTLLTRTFENALLKQRDGSLSTQFLRKSEGQYGTMHHCWQLSDQAMKYVGMIHLYWFDFEANFMCACHAIETTTNEIQHGRITMLHRTFHIPCTFQVRLYIHNSGTLKCTTQSLHILFSSP